MVVYGIASSLPHDIDNFYAMAAEACIAQPARFSYALPTATGLAWEHAAATTAGMPATDDAALVQSRIAFQPVFKSEQDLRNPRLVGRYLRVPSAAGLASGVAQEIWATMEEEQALSDRQSFRFLSSDEIG